MRQFGPDVTLNNPAFIHDTALLHGKVFVDEDASFFPYSVVRCELHEVRIGKRTNIQDFVMIHVGSVTPTIIGENCSITHHCTIHGATIGDNVLVGINSTIMDGAVIGNNCIIGGHTIVTQNTVIPDNSVVMGSPGKVVKSRDCGEANRGNADFYVNFAKNYAQGIERM